MSALTRDAIKWKARALIAEQQLKLYPEMLVALEAMVATCVTCSNRPGQEAAGEAAFSQANALVAKARRIK